MRGWVILIVLVAASPARAGESPPDPALPRPEEVERRSDARFVGDLARLESDRRDGRSLRITGLVLGALALVSTGVSVAIFAEDHRKCTQPMVGRCDGALTIAGLAVAGFAGENIVISLAFLATGIARERSAAERTRRLLAPPEAPATSRADRERKDLERLIERRKSGRATQLTAAWIGGATVAGVIYTIASGVVAKNQTCGFGYSGFECGGFWPVSTLFAAVFTANEFVLGALFAIAGGLQFTDANRTLGRLYPNASIGPTGGSLGLTLAF